MHIYNIEIICAQINSIKNFKRKESKKEKHDKRVF